MSKCATRFGFYFKTIIRHTKCILSLIHSMEQSASWELTCSQSVKKLPAFYEIRRFITAFPSARHLSLSWARSIQSIPVIPLTEDRRLILSDHLLLGLSRGLFPSRHQNPVSTSPLPTHVTCPTHLILDLITRIYGEQYRSLSFSLFSFLHSPNTSSLLDPNILLSTLFANTLSLYSSLNVSYQVSHP